MAQVFQCTNDGVYANFEHTCGIVNFRAVESHFEDQLFNTELASFVYNISLRIVNKVKTQNTRVNINNKTATNKV
ncbi:hypothetical protein Pcaca05_18640 [Pectobacterium carotovorum subsp. carotovorum]|nr:hypothetical protein Pcaca05_18640 [Pectobacterium carotovorum subsp. carotovorum]